MGTILSNLGRHEEALVCYLRAIEIEPENPDLWNNRGSALHQLGRYQEAQESYSWAIGLDPLHEYAWHNQGLLEPTLDQETEEAYALLRERIYVETEMRNALSGGERPEDGEDNEKLTGWRGLLMIAAIAAAGRISIRGGRGRAFHRDPLSPPLNKLIIFTDRSLRRRRP
jgi:tetratricopeptide (TPR) repeat protein